MRKFIYLLLALPTFIFAQKTSSSEKDFKDFLRDDSVEVAEKIIREKDGLYSLYCEAEMLDDPEKEIKLYTKFIDQNPAFGLAKAILSRGVAYSELENQALAMTDYDKSIALDSSDAFAFQFRGMLYQELEDYEKSTADFIKVLELQPDSKYALQGLGGNYFYTDDLDKALEYLNKSLKIDDKYGMTYFTRGAVYVQKGEYKNAIADLTKAKKLNPNLKEDADSMIATAKEEMKNENKHGK